MPVLTDNEKAILIYLLAGIIIERHPFPQSAQVQQLRGILGKLRAPEQPQNSTTKEQ